MNRVRLQVVLFGAGLLIGAACATGLGSPSGPGSPGAVSAAPADVPAGIRFEGGDGLSCATRVLVRGAADGDAGIAAEYAWLRWKYPGHQVQGQTLSKCDEKFADFLRITTADGQAVTVHFDVSEFFGKGHGL